MNRSNSQHVPLPCHMHTGSILINIPNISPSVFWNKPAEKPALFSFISARNIYPDAKDAKAKTSNTDHVEQFNKYTRRHPKIKGLGYILIRDFPGKLIAGPGTIRISMTESVSPAIIVAVGRISTIYGWNRNKLLSHTLESREGGSGPNHEASTRSKKSKQGGRIREALA